MENPELFTNTIINDARITSQKLFNLPLESLSPLQFIELTSKLIQQKIQPNKLATRLSSFYGMGENVRINLIPIDQIYLKGGIR